MKPDFPILAADVSLERRLEFARFPGGWTAVATLVLLAGLLYVVFFLYRREQRAGASPRRRMALASLRGMVIVTLAVVWLGPVLATYIHRRVESFTLVLLDASASMTIRDRYPNVEDARRVERALAGMGAAMPAELTREQVVEWALGRDGGRLMRELAERNAVEVFGFADRLTPLGRVGAGGG